MDGDFEHDDDLDGAPPFIFLKGVQCMMNSFLFQWIESEMHGVIFQKELEIRSSVEQRFSRTEFFLLLLLPPPLFRNRGN